MERLQIKVSLSKPHVENGMTILNSIRIVTATTEWLKYPGTGVGVEEAIGDLILKNKDVLDTEYGLSVTV